MLRFFYLQVIEDWKYLQGLGWVVGFEPIVRMWDLGQRGESALRRGLSKGSLREFRRKPRKTNNG